MCSVKPQNALAGKGEVVEEWIDLHFFRPLGFRLANALRPTRVNPDQVTMASHSGATTATAPPGG
jgi:hypothetical protein